MKTITPCDRVSYRRYHISFSWLLACSPIGRTCRHFMAKALGDSRRKKLALSDSRSGRTLMPFSFRLGVKAKLRPPAIPPFGSWGQKSLLKLTLRSLHLSVRPSYALRMSAFSNSSIAVLISPLSGPESRRVVKSFPVLEDYARRIHYCYFADYEAWE